jgi:hypothetical protein
MVFVSLRWLCRFFQWGRSGWVTVLDTWGEKSWEASVKYVILVYGNAKTREIWDSMTEEQRLEGWRGHTAVREGLAASGELVISEALADPSLTKRVSAAMTTTDGPFAEVKEHLAGFYLVDCENIDRAIEHAAKLPEATFGLVEVRPVLDVM